IGGRKLPLGRDPPPGEGHAQARAHDGGRCDCGERARQRFGLYGAAAVRLDTIINYAASGPRHATSSQRLTFAALLNWLESASGKPHSLGQSGKRPDRHPYHAANAEWTETIACSRGGIGRAP